jgi:tricorn protease
MANSKGYFRFPTVNKNKIAFVADDDLWLLENENSIPRRLTSNLSDVTHPKFSADGKWIAFTAKEEGQMEIYLVSSEGGEIERLTYLGGRSFTVGWRNNEIIFRTDAESPHAGYYFLYSININTRVITKLIKYGVATDISFGNGFTVLGRNTLEPARWKRYRGGTAGELWIDRNNRGNYEKFLDLKGNFACPMVIGKRIYFISDHERVGNIYSSDISGNDIKKHTRHNFFYARNASTDGNRIVYHCGADLYELNLKTNRSRKLNFEYRSASTQTMRKFIDAERYLEDYDISKDASRMAVTTRGKVFAFGNWEGPAVQLPNSNGCRFRLARWIDKDNTIALMSDNTGEYRVNIFNLNNPEKVTRLNNVEIGFPYDMKVSPDGNKIAVINHRNEIFIIDLQNKSKTPVDRDMFGNITGFNWSPDSRYLAYSIRIDLRTKIIKIFSLPEGKSHIATSPLLNDFEPSFDPTGKYMYLLSARILNPIYDMIHFDLGFPKATKPFCVVLQKNNTSPFCPAPKGFDDDAKDKRLSDAEEDKNKNRKINEIRIDFNGIEDRMVPVPSEEAIYKNIGSTSDKIFYTKFEPEGARFSNNNHNLNPPANGELKYFDLMEQTEKKLLSGVSEFKISPDNTAIIVRIGNKLRVLKTASEELEHIKENGKPARKNGWLDLSRVRVQINQRDEWRQMFREGWRLQREFYWVESMSNINWKKVFDEYYPLVDRVASRAEFSDLMWEMQGELGTSHAYEMGGDYRPWPVYNIGKLGVDYEYDKNNNAYKITNIYSGDTWDDQVVSPLKAPGVNVKVGDLIREVNGFKVTKENEPNKLLLNYNGKEVRLKVSDGSGRNNRYVNVKTISSDLYLRYRDWVAFNKEYVHKKTRNKVGYIHIPDMGADGFAEFHRHFLTELDYDGLVVDVRNNGGGHVSQLLLEKLARKRIGADVARWFGSYPYPAESVKGSMVMLTDEYAGSDGDIVSHAFKLMGLGKLIGKRTWGGVIGIWPRFALADGTLTTQPEFSTWFKDAKWGVENYGTDPDIPVDNKPQDFVKGVDAQLDKAIEVVLEEIKMNPPEVPDFTVKPDLSK